MRLLIAGGGTGGHLFPGVALVEELLERDPTAKVLFVGTARGIEARVVPELGYDLALIEISGVKTVGIRKAIRGLFSVPRALWQSRRIIKKFRPDAVIGVGGYASGPLVLMARLMRKQSAVIEQNSIPGLTNKILGTFVHKVFLTFDETRRFFKSKKIVMSGNPIRKQILASLQDAVDVGSATAAGADATDTDPTPDRPPHLFIFGGSQGAAAVNELVAGAAKLLAERDIRFTALHQTGKADLEATRARYAEAGIDADCRAFIKDMAGEYQRADLIIARSGATTVAELGVVGCPAVLIPYPYAADNHQEINAKELVDAGAAKMFRQADLTALALADSLEKLLGDTDALARMGSAMNALGKPQAAETIIDWAEAKTKG